MTKLFDPINVMNEELGEGATKRELLPQDSVIAQIGKIKWNEGDISKGERAGQKWYRADFPMEITDGEYLKNYADGSSTKAVITYGVMVDVTDEGKIATGPNKNIKLNRLRSAAGVNGRPLAALEGQFVRIQIGWNQVVRNGEPAFDEKGNPEMKDEVVAVASPNA